MCQGTKQTVTIPNNVCEGSWGFQTNFRTSRCNSISSLSPLLRTSPAATLCQLGCLEWTRKGSTRGHNHYFFISSCLNMRDSAVVGTITALWNSGCSIIWNLWGIVWNEDSAVVGTITTFWNTDCSIIWNFWGIIWNESRLLLFLPSCLLPNRKISN